MCIRDRSSSVASTGGFAFELVRGVGFAEGCATPSRLAARRLMGSAVPGTETGNRPAAFSLPTISPRTPFRSARDLRPTILT
eukprot:250053-Prymnesium_polylepis.1